jgi:hypothetical protein
MCSIPDLSGDYKEGKCDLNTIYAVLFDMIVYNNIDVILRKSRMGILREEIYNKERGIQVDIAEKKEGGQDVDEDDDELKKVDGVFPIEIGPDGSPLKRNPSDVMNNFFINYAVRTFTSIEKLIKNTNTTDSRQAKKFLVHIDKKKQEWSQKTVNEFTKQSNKYENFAKQ